MSGLDDEAEPRREPTREPRREPRSAQSTWGVYVAVHGVLLLLTAFVLLYLGPRFGSMFEVFEDTAEASDLPLSSLALIRTSYWVRTYWYVAALAPALLLGLDGWLMYRFQCSGSEAALRRWSTAVVVVLAVLIGLMILGFYLPLTGIN